MDKIEFSDVYKFLASIGILLMGLSVLIPWFINHNASFLLIESKKLTELTATAKTIIENQQNSLLTFNGIIVWISPILFAMGLSLTAWSVFSWRKRQLVIDGIQDEELKSKQMQNISEVEKRNLVREDITDEILVNSEIPIEDFHAQEIQQETLDDQVDKYIDLENRIYNSILKTHQNSFAAFQNIKIENVTFDIVLRAKPNQVSTDRLIEIKYFKSNLNFDILSTTLSTLVTNGMIYRQSLRRQCVFMLIIIYENVEFPDLLIQYKKRLQQQAKDLGQTARVNFYKLTDIKPDTAINFLVDNPRIPLS